MPVDTRGRFFPSDENRPEAEVVSGARTTSGVFAVFSTNEARELEATLNVTAVSGTSPSLTVFLETSVDGTNFDTVGSFPAATGATTRGKVFGPLGDTCRWSYTISGTTPSFTFSVAVNQEH